MINMTLQIDSFMLEKLTHSSSEIRLRALENVESRFFRSISGNITLIFEPEQLVKQLIFWFKTEPLIETDRVLRFLSTLLSSDYGDKVLNKFGVDRLCTELDKIYRFIQSDQETVKILIKIKAYIRSKTELCEKLLDNMHLPMLTDVIYNMEFNDIEENLTLLKSDSYEVPWSKPCLRDITAMKVISDLISNTSTPLDQIENILLNFRSSMADYPAHHFLQVPHLYNKLMQLYDRFTRESSTSDILCSLLINYTQLLNDCIKKRRISLPPPSDTIVNAENINENQLKPEVAMGLLLKRILLDLSSNLCVYHSTHTTIFNMLEKIFDIFRTLHKPVPFSYVSIIGQLVKRVRCYCDHTTSLKLPRLKCILLSNMHLDLVEYHFYYFGWETIPAEALDSLRLLLFDFGQMTYECSTFNKLNNLLKSGLPHFSVYCSQLKEYETSLFIFINQLIEGKEQLSPFMLLEKFHDIAHLLDRLNSVKMIEILFDAIEHCMAASIENENLRRHIDECLENMASLQSDRLCVMFSTRLRAAFMTNYHCLLHNDHYIPLKSNVELVNAGIFGVPLRKYLLQIITIQSNENVSNYVRKNYLDCLLLLLMSQKLLRDDFEALYNLLEPILVFIICASIKDGDLLNVLMELHCPDTSVLSSLSLLRGNICFLFHPEKKARIEALNRLIYKLQLHDTNNELLPHLNLIKTTLPSDICLTLTPYNYLQIFCNRQFGGSAEQADFFSILHKLIMDDSRLEHRNFVVTEINKMLQHFETTSLFIDMEAIYYPIEIIKSHMIPTADNYKEMTRSSMSILAKVLFVKSNFRTNMAFNEDDLMLILRVLLIHYKDEEMRLTASIVLFQLIFEDFMLADANNVSIPNIVSNLHVPVTHKVYSVVKGNKNSAMIREEILVSDYFAGNKKEALSYVRMYIAKILFKNMFQCTDAELKTLENLDINPILKINENELLLLKATNPFITLLHYLDIALNAEDHCTLIKCIRIICLYHIHLGSNLKQKLANEHKNLLRKYLDVKPGNNNDCIIYEEMLTLCDACINNQMKPVIFAFKSSLENDQNHAFFALLKDQSTPISVLLKLTNCLTNLIKTLYNLESKEILHPWYGNFYECLLKICIQYFEKRDLVRSACLIQLLNALSEHCLGLTDQQLKEHCREMLRLCYEIRISTQRGANWQRQCLQIVCRLREQMKQPNENFEFSQNVLQYLIYLAAHQDTQVRSASWVILSKLAVAYLATYRSKPESFMDDCILLPGGFMACSLATMLDNNEAIVVRQLAGNIFAQLLVIQDATKILKLITVHKFLNKAMCCLYMVINQPPEIKDDSYMGLLCCYLNICSEILQLLPNWLDTLIQHEFTINLYEVFKMNTLMFSQTSSRLFGKVCQFYTLFYPCAFNLLQSTMCRDNVMLNCIISKLPIIAEFSAFNHIHCLKLLLVLCKDDFAYLKIIQAFKCSPSTFVNFIRLGLNMLLINTPQHSYTLSLLTLILVKIQKNLSENITVSLLLETVVTTNWEKPFSNFLYYSDVNDKQTHASSTSKNAANESITESILDNTHVAIILFSQLHKIFAHFYPLNGSKFTQTPTMPQTQICETLGVLLKFGPESLFANGNVAGLLSHITQVLQNFLNEFNFTATTYVRQHGEHKSTTIINNLKILFQLLLNWYSSPHAVIFDEHTSATLIKLIVQITPWLQHSSDLKQVVIYACAALTKNSYAICKQMTMLYASASKSMLQLIIKAVNFETNAIRAATSINFVVIKQGLRVMMHCASYADGRLCLIKCHVLDIFDTILPEHNVSHQKKIKPMVLNDWLCFWEFFSRFEHGANACHLQALYATIQRFPANSLTRIYCLRILRNMSFFQSNRAKLTTSVDFLKMSLQIIQNTTLLFADGKTPVKGAKSGIVLSLEEQHLIVITLRKLFGTSVKHKVQLRGTKLLKQLHMLKEMLTSLEQKQPDKLSSINFAHDLTKQLQQLFDSLEF